MRLNRQTQQLSLDLEARLDDCASPQKVPQVARGDSGITNLCSEREKRQRAHIAILYARILETVKHLG
jgi:hypothetical protein